MQFQQTWCFLHTASQQARSRYLPGRTEITANQFCFRVAKQPAGHGSDLVYRLWENLLLTMPFDPQACCDFLAVLIQKYAGSSIVCVQSSAIWASAATLLSSRGGV